MTLPIGECPEGVVGDLRRLPRPEVDVFVVDRVSCRRRLADGKEDAVEVIVSEARVFYPRFFVERSSPAYGGVDGRCLAMRAV